MAIASGTLLTTAVVAGAAATTSAVAGKLASDAKRGQAENAMKAAYQQIEDLGAPPELARQIIQEKLTQAGVYTPELEQAIAQDATKFSAIQEDPQLKDAQVQALQALKQRGAQGLTATEKQAFNQTRRQIAQESEAKRQQILQNLASRGMSGSGAELAAQLSASQAGDERLSQEGDRLAATAAQQALQATLQAGQLGGQVRAQDFDVASSKARAEDELNRFNTSNQIARQQRNVASENQAQAANLAEKQRISDYNTNLANQERLRQRQAEQQDWQNKYNLAAAKSGQYQNQANQYQQQGAQDQKFWNDLGSGVSGAVSGIGAANIQDNAFSKLLKPQQTDDDKAKEEEAERYRNL